ncbi:MAG: aminotransferase class V-fold PLP-dependent enzyme [Armatimonadetes bacterium]|nr:aminotransferase class V-fold PLP-dependent enzyme [Armatimonadota bacterium]
MAERPEAAGVDPATLSWAALRALVPAATSCRYLNLGTLAPGVAPLLAETDAGYRAWMESGPGLPLAYFGAKQAADVARAHLALSLHVGEDEIALLGNSSDAINVVACGIDWRPGDEVVITDEEHHAGLFPWLRLQQQGIVRVREVPLGTDVQRIVDAFDRAITPRTRVVAISHVTCHAGVNLPVGEIGRIARDRGAFLLLDGSQSAGHVPLDLPAFPWDAYAITGHKWLFGPVGTGALILRREHLERLPPSWVGSGSGDLRVENGTSRIDYHLSARRYEFGTRDWTKFVAWDAAMTFVERIGVERAFQRGLALGVRLHDQLSSVPGVEMISARDGSLATCLVAFRVAGWDAQPLMETLWHRWRIAVRAVPEKRGIRVTIAFFNDESDLEALVAAVAELAAAPAKAGAADR